MVLRSSLDSYLAVPSIIEQHVVAPFKLTLIHQKFYGANRDYYEIVVARQGTVWDTSIVRGDEAAARERFEQWKPVIASEVAKIALGL